MASEEGKLDRLTVPIPCFVPWETMQGDETVRSCGQCRKNVYNLSALTREDAEALIEAKEGRLCVRFYQRMDGTILTSDCQVPVFEPLMVTAGVPMMPSEPKPEPPVKPETEEKRRSRLAFWRR